MGFINVGIDFKNDAKLCSDPTPSKYDALLSVKKFQRK